MLVGGRVCFEGSSDEYEHWLAARLGEVFPQRTESKREGTCDQASDYRGADQGHVPEPTLGAERQRCADSEGKEGEEQKLQSGLPKVIAAEIGCFCVRLFHMETHQVPPHWCFGSVVAGVEPQFPKPNGGSRSQALELSETLQMRCLF